MKQPSSPSRALTRTGRLSPSIAALMLFLGILAAFPALAADSNPGWSATEPASGRFVKTEQGYMIPYTAAIPGSKATFEMVPVPGGTFLLGSPDSEADRQEEEGPQLKVTVEPFWMGKYEVTWSEYKEFMRLYNMFKDFEFQKIRVVSADNQTDAVTIPTPLYDPSYTFALGEEPRQPAVTISRYSARQYTKWVSLLTGQFYRLPTEAEWEYACRAGSETAYSFGDDPAELDDYAWYYDNADEAYHEVGEKKPNAWDLYDMHGNVAELVLDQYAADAYTQHDGKSVPAGQALVPTTKEIPSVIRGGSWDDEPDRLRCAARGQTEDWREDDPNLPKSPWWFADDPSLCVGFRILRPVSASPREQQDSFWNADSLILRQAIEDRMSGGRGAIGLVDPALPEVVSEHTK